MKRKVAYLMFVRIHSKQTPRFTTNCCLQRIRKQEETRSEGEYDK